MRPANPWYQQAVIYELHVRSFCDSDGDGVGDFIGLTSKLDYLKEMGVSAIWLLPFYPSPLRDDGYDIADYFSVNPAYGTFEDFRNFLAEAHRRELRVITELVINHTSDQNPWFQRARSAAPGTSERDFYVWSESPERYRDARIIFKDFEASNWTWDPVAKAYFWHRFYSHQPDLNFENPEVHSALFKVVDFWLNLGVDGLRLDAVPYLYEREGTSCENLPETHAFLKKLRAHIDARFADRMLLAEANQWPEDAAAYFGNGDECHMEFHFPLMPRLFMALQMEDRFPIIDILDQTPAIPESCQWAIFLRNHDELTLEMVTDEERDYMVRIYAEDARARINLGIRRRLAPLLGNNRRKIELIHALLLSLPGTPILYYGDEIGMGDNFYLGDRNGVRTPMQWSADRNAGFSRANPQQLFLPVVIDPEFHYEFVNVDMQLKNLSSLHWWIRRVLAIRKQTSAFADGRIEFLASDNPKTLTYLRENDSERLLVVANLSRFSQAVTLDLSAYAGHQPEELFGANRFPMITKEPYHLTVGPHGFFWLRLTSVTPRMDRFGQAIALPPEWSDALKRELLAGRLENYLKSCRWFGGKQKTSRQLRILGETAVSGDDRSQIWIVEVIFSEGSAARVLLPLRIVHPDEFRDPLQSVIASFASGEVLIDATLATEFRERLFALIAGREKWSSTGVTWWGVAPGPISGPADSRLLGAEQSNTSIVFGEKWALKLIRNLEPGAHPEAEILRALGQLAFPAVPAYGGELTVNYGHGPVVAGLLTGFVPNEGDGWSFTLDALGRFFERVLANPDLPAEELIGGNYPARIRQLGSRTGELHANLSRVIDPAFTPEPFTGLYQRSLYQSLRSLARRTESELRGKLTNLPESLQAAGGRWLDELSPLLEAYSELRSRRIRGAKIRVHGDYHLGQVLNTGKDFVIVDFEGEPRRSLGERLLKRPPLVDVAGMLRSLDYAVQTALEPQAEASRNLLNEWGIRWRQTISRAFLEGYLAGAGGATFLPDNGEDFQFLLRLLMIDKAVYEIGYELQYRPEKMFIPFNAIHEMLTQPQVIPEFTYDR